MKKVWIWIIAIVALFIIVLAGVSVYYSLHYKPILKKKLTQYVAGSSDSLYRLSYDDLRINLLTGTATLANAKLESDSLIYKNLVRRRKAPKSRFDIGISALTFNGFSWWDFLIRRQLHISELRIDTAHIHLFTSAITPRDTDSQPKTLYQTIKGTFKAVHVERIDMVDVNFQSSKTQDNGQRESIKIRNVRLRATDFLVNATTESDTNRTYYAKEIDVRIPKWYHQISGSVYAVSFDNVHVNTKEETASLTNLKIAPTISKQAYFKNDKENKALIFLRMDSVAAGGFKAQQLVRHKRLYSREIYLKKGIASFHKDKRFQKDNVSKIGQAPHQQIMKMSQSILFDTVFVKGVDIVYNQFSDKYLKEGSIAFNNVRGEITNVTNDTTCLVKNRYMRADLDADLMGTGLLQARLYFDMLSKTGHHGYKGTLGPMEAPAFNRILRPLLNIEIGSGHIRNIRFDMEGTDHKNWGTFYFDYDNLKVNLFHPPAAGKNRKKKKILTFLVNQVLVNDSNPDANEVYHVGKVDYTRVPEYSHFKTIWKSLFEGIAQCVGLNPKYIPDSG